MFDRSTPSRTEALERPANARESRELDTAKVVLRMAANELPADRDGALKAYLAQPGKLADAAAALTGLAREPAKLDQLLPRDDPRNAAAAPLLSQFVSGLPAITTPNARTAANDVLNRAVEAGGAANVTAFIDRAIADRKTPPAERAAPQKADARLPEVEIACRPGERAPELSRPKPNTLYKVTELDATGRPLATRTYETDGLGRTVHATGELLNITGTRNQYDQQRVGGKDRREGPLSKPGTAKGTRDDGGHLIGTEFDGRGEAINMVAQDSWMNEHGPWRKMEIGWKKALDTGHKVSVDIREIYVGDSLRPDRTRVIENIDGKIKSYTFKNEPDGK